PRLVPSLAELDLAIREPAPDAIENAVLEGQVDDITFETDPFVPQHVEFGLPEGRGELVLDDLDFHANADGRFTVLERAQPADVHSTRTVELEGPPAGGRFGATEHHPDLLADLIDEDHAGLGFGNGARQFAHRLAHHSGLQPNVRVADL